MGAVQLRLFKGQNPEVSIITQSLPRMLMTTGCLGYAGEKVGTRFQMKKTARLFSDALSSVSG